MIYCYYKYIYKWDIYSALFTVKALTRAHRERKTSAKANPIRIRSPDRDHFPNLTGTSLIVQIYDYDKTLTKIRPVFKRCEPNCGNCHIAQCWRIRRGRRRRRRGNVGCSPWAHWKAHSGLPVSVNWTFSARCYGWGATSENRLKIGDFAPTGAGWPKISGWRGRHLPTMLLLRKLG